MDEITQRNLTLTQALKYLYLGDKIWSEWSGEKNSVYCHYYDYREEVPHDIEAPLAFWSILKYGNLDQYGDPITWGEILKPCWCAETTPWSV